jgi:hypothetical protein
MATNESKSLAGKNEREGPKILGHCKIANCVQISIKNAISPFTAVALLVAHSLNVRVHRDSAIVFRKVTEAVRKDLKTLEFDQPARGHLALGSLSRLKKAARSRFRILELFAKLLCLLLNAGKGLQNVFTPLSHNPHIEPRTLPA